MLHFTVILVVKPQYLSGSSAALLRLAYHHDPV
ncbi:hypothetical protein V6Z11_A12G102200 [Gossypium hirsutum]